MSCTTQVPACGLPCTYLYVVWQYVNAVWQTLTRMNLFKLKRNGPNMKGGVWCQGAFNTGDQLRNEEDEGLGEMNPFWYGLSAGLAGSTREKLYRPSPPSFPLRFKTYLKGLSHED